jgi:hypothetical protein
MMLAIYVIYIHMMLVSHIAFLYWGIFILLLVSCFNYYCAGLRYFGVFTKVLRLYQIYHTWIHPLHCSFIHHSWNSFNQYQFCIYLHVCTLFAPPPHSFSKDFIMNIGFCQTHFFTSVKMIWFLSLILFMSFMTFTDLCILNYPWISGIKQFDLAV